MSINIFVREDEETKKLNATLRQRKVAFAKANEEAKIKAVEGKSDRDVEKGDAASEKTAASE